jgi:hypothetical protein
MVGHRQHVVLAGRVLRQECQVRGRGHEELPAVCTRGLTTRALADLRSKIA